LLLEPVSLIYQGQALPLLLKVHLQDTSDIRHPILDWDKSVTLKISSTRYKAPQDYEA